MTIRDYAKIDNGRLAYAKNPLWLENKTMIANPTEADLLRLGYKKVIMGEYPKLSENEYAEAIMIEAESAIEIRYERREAERNDLGKTE